MLRRASWLLLAAAALPATPLLAQDTGPVIEPPPPTVTIPPVTLPDPAPMPTPTPQPPVSQTLPPATTSKRPLPAAEAPAAPQRSAATRTTRTRTVTAQPRAQAPVRRAAPAAPAATAAPAAVAAPAAPAAETAVPPPAATPAPLPVPQEPARTTAGEIAGVPIWTWAVGAALLLLAAFALFNMRRHRRRVEEYDEVYHDEPVAAEPVRDSWVEERAVTAAPAIAAGAALAANQTGDRRDILSTPMGDVVAPAEFETAAEDALVTPEEVAVAEPDQADVEALAATSAAPDGRPWLEFLMRPIRAGTSKDATVVEFELTVGNTGTVPARDVRISTFMFAAGSAGESEMERMLIDPPAGAAAEEVTIAAGEATRVDAQMALPREGLADGTVRPVVVADARYRLPDGTEGRTRASFEVGIPTENGLDPFPTDRTSGLLESVEARLHGEPERV